MKVLLQPGIWIAGGPATLVNITLYEDNATDFVTKDLAYSALKEARKYQSFKDAILEEGFL